MRPPRALTTMALLLLLAAPAFASPFSEYEIPRHSWYTLTGRLDATAFRGSGSLGDESGSDRSWRGIASLAGQWGLDSDSDVRILSASVAGRGVGERSEGSRDLTVESPPTVTREDREGRDDLWSAVWAIDGLLRRYAGDSPFGVMLEASASGNYDRHRIRLDSSFELVQPGVHTRTVEDNDLDADLDLHQVRGTASAIAGRVRDATPVYSAWLLERRLRETGAIEGPLQPSTRRRLAALYAVQGRYGIVHDRPGRFFLRDLEEILRDDGALGPEGLDAYSVLRLVEPVVGRSGPFQRRRGWLVGASFGGSYRRASERLSQRSRYRIYDFDTLTLDGSTRSDHRIDFRTDAVVVGAVLEAHAPLGMRWQIDAASRVLAPRGRIDREFSLASEAHGTWVAAERWWFDASLSHSRTVGDPALSGDVWSVSYGASVSWFLEDRLALSLRAFEGQGSDGFGGYGRSAALSLGLTYHLLGRLVVPGLIEPMTLLR